MTGILEKLSFYFLLILSLVLMFSLFQNVQRVRNVDDQIRSKELEVENAKREAEDLAKKLEMAKSQTYIEQQIRDKLGMAKEGEIVVILPSDEILRSIAPVNEEKSLPVPEPNWKKWLKVFL